MNHRGTENTAILTEEKKRLEKPTPSGRASNRSAQQTRNADHASNTHMRPA